MSDNGTHILQTDKATIKFGGLTAVNELSMDVGQGEIYGLIGPNGAGKTTLLQVASAMIHPSSGTAHILNDTLGRVDVFDLRPRIGFASTAMAKRIPTNERVLDVVLTAAYAVAGRWNEAYEDIDVRRAQRVLAEWQLDHLEQRRFGLLSDGEQKRVQIARAVMTDPELLLLDEPAASLDLGAREELLQLLGGYARAELAPAIIMVTHHVEEIPIGFTHALLLSHGRISAAGPIHEVITSEKLSDAFGLPLEVEERDGRFAARGAISF